MKSKYALGQEVRDTITGFSGVVTSVTHWLNGCVRVGVQPRELKDGKPIDAEVFDEEQLEAVKKSATEKAGRRSGGPCPDKLALRR
ncbi:MAG: hypothetical protein JRN42_08210 [Nitrososphaerota archaeon]|nr:hypothetical protein [Nitrososphaerota archaeon]